MMSLIQKYFVEIIVALGGNIAAILILLRFGKARAEKYLDTLIETKASEHLAEFESNLEKKKMYFEVAIAEEQELYKKIIDLYGKIIPLLSQNLEDVQKLLNKNLVFSSAQNIIANCNELQIIIEPEKDSFVQESVYLESSINKAHQNILNLINIYIADINSNKNEYDLSVEQKRKLLNDTKNIIHATNDNISNLRKIIEKKTH